MARRPLPEQRLAKLIDAAIAVFIARGFRRTQMSDIARAAGVSQGTLYNYVESKEALFYLIIDRGFADSTPPQIDQLPIRTPPFEATVARLRERMATEMSNSGLKRALSSSPPADARAELEAIVREYYSAVARMRRGFDLVERSAIDLPELAQLLYIERRRTFIADLTRYIESRIASGAFRPLPDPPTAARLLLETVVWFARHRHRTPDSSMISDEVALETTVDFLVNGLLAHRARKAARKLQPSRMRTTKRGITSPKR